MSFRSSHGKTQHHQLALILGIDFGRGDIEAIPEPIQDAADDLPLVLQTAGLPQQQANPERTDEHGLLPRQEVPVRPARGANGNLPFR